MTATIFTSFRISRPMLCIGRSRKRRVRCHTPGMREFIVRDFPLRGAKAGKGHPVLCLRVILRLISRTNGLLDMMKDS